MKNPLAAHPPWRQIVIVSIALPAVIVLAVLAFAWPAARIAPREPSGRRCRGRRVDASRSCRRWRRPSRVRFDLHLYADEAAARRGDRRPRRLWRIRRRPGQLTVLEASAASPTVAQLLTTVGEELAQRFGEHLYRRRHRAGVERRPARLGAEFGRAAADHLLRHRGRDRRGGRGASAGVAADRRAHGRRAVAGAGSLPDRADRSSVRCPTTVGRPGPPLR